MQYEIKEYSPDSPEEVLSLYTAVGWTNYTERPQMLRSAYEHSLCVLAAYCGEKLIGLIRAVGDGYSIVFIQDLLVDPSCQRKGIGSALLTALRERYPDVYQMHLMTDDTVRSRKFYEANGFAEGTEMGCLAYTKVK